MDREAHATTHIVLAGGGTAGHVNPLLAVAAAISRREPDAEVVALGTAVGLEASLVPAAGYQLETIEKVPFPRRPNAYLFKFPAKWAKETRKVRDILTGHHADVVVGFGGYASAPAYSAAHKMGIPVVIHEQNARAGMANKLGSRYAEFIGTAYDNTGLTPGKAKVPASAVNHSNDSSAGAASAASGTVTVPTVIERVGLPLRPAIADLAARLETDRAAARRDGAKALGLDPDRPIVVVTGGSLGAVSLNRAVAGAAKDLLAHAQVVHLTGKGKIDEVRDLVIKSAGADVLTGLGEESTPGRDYHAAQYLERIDLAFACADLVICRSGAGSVSELTALGLPAIYVPLPIGNGEQRFNAQPVVEAGGGMLVADRDFTADWVRANVPGLLANPAKLREFGDRAWQYGIRDAADRMAVRILDIAHRNH
ncbi:UDP-N-acetylglucosamine--N-acetylmuramyl-(pentapeptide) pyrophosphoryl-undecaprenol N-acetylglucosamine transferase [Bifidobacterium choloepi]|uniref:UDP-N-acetylglucosamine--N-acetylmuramyl-(pentapeptide) pyrophosphoryl-undecaprenol N-acetylglucosamine transferase n=1 Tax=Bifidobacterium choloepi TaxID=2614131 RepID=A0A6I5NC02_9BIFI|nr:UDP-N-acetylglucosamine--N-acetylmuramyl-(pentapeptide) pyrophosphoryl-undecaprenol N-acetylglucosamine transferase [Bifidobacterium choloepi]NEG70050.1 UDP-N-acetylglucosamine--N-acetylmuramyl-(pentapeptide) pyrophosphoryl-undecaprenol N-acetylglucosamine transferase [Bifidobacterium choloepi]